MGRLLCYGDSNTYGYDPRSYLGGRYSEPIRWTALLNGADWTVIDEGENGRSIPRPAWEIETAVQAIFCSKADAWKILNDWVRKPIKMSRIGSGSPAKTKRHLSSERCRFVLVSVMFRGTPAKGIAIVRRAKSAICPNTMRP